MFCRHIFKNCLHSKNHVNRFYKKKVLFQNEPTVYQSFCSTSRLTSKKFMDKENFFAHDVLVTSSKMYQLFRYDTNNFISDNIYEVFFPIIVLQPPKAEDITSDEVFKIFCDLADYCRLTVSCISNERFQTFTILFCKFAYDLTDHQLIESMRYLKLLPKTDSVKSANYVEIWNTIDLVCCERIDRWTTNQLLLFCDAWYTLNLARISEFVWAALEKLGRKVKQMSPEQMIQCMFMCNIVRKPPFDMLDFELNFNICIEKLNLQEIGVLAMGFFKTQTPLRNPVLIDKIYERLTVDLDIVEDITLVSLLKVLRYSSKLAQVEPMMLLLERLCSHIERISLLSCLHIALLGSDIQYCHEPSLELILHRFNRDLQGARLKDIERLCFVLGMFNYESPTGIDRVLCLSILEHLKSKVEEVIKYPRCFPTCIHFLTIKGLYNMEMISSVLEPRFIKHAYTKNLTMGRELFHLDSFVKINLEYKNYEGHKLTDRQRKSMGKMLTHYIPERNTKYKLNVTDRVLLEVKETTDRIYRNNYLKHVLPHFQRPDVVICYNRKKKKALVLSPECPANYSGVILRRYELLSERDYENIDTITIVVAGWNNMVRGKGRTTGLFNMKLQQLMLLGHKYIVIYWHEWRELETQKDRDKFLKRKLATVINL